MTLKQLIGLQVLIFGVAFADLFTNEANALLPRLFVLDDYERCLSRQEGLYCLGVFQLTPLGNSSVYQRIQEYSSSPFTFNRLRLHRGYCVSERCPSRARNATRRFERCVSERARSHALSARLHTLHHCTTHAQHINKHKQPLDTPQQLFLQFICAILVFNILGTTYDIGTGNDDSKKLLSLAVWSVRANWQRLTATYEAGNTRIKDFEPVQGMRVVAALLTMYVHIYVRNFHFFVINPQFLENMTYGPDGVWMANGTSFIQVFTMLSIFITSYSMLVYSQSRTLSLKMLPILIIKRIARIAPVIVLLIGFIATWWPRILSGPFHSFATEESVICRKKFWSHVFFYNNLVDKHNRCLPPSWYIPVDMHLHIVAFILVTFMQHRKKQARKFFFIGFIVSCLFCGVISYIPGWQTMSYYAVPENIRDVFLKVESFGEYYTSTWAGLPACFLGLYMAYLFNDIKGTAYYTSKWIIMLQCLSPVLISVYLVVVGSLVRQYNHPLATAAYLTVDRPTIMIAYLFFILGGLKIKVCREFFSWQGWRVPARLTLPVMMGHWLIDDYIVARPVAYYVSHFTVITDFILSVVFSHLIAVPISLLLEIPVQRFISQFI